MNSSYEIKGKFTGIDQITSGFRRIYDEAGRVGKRIEDNARRSEQAWKKHQTVMSQMSAGYDRLVNVGPQISSIWRHQAESLRSYTDAAMHLVAVQQRLLTLNLGPEDNDKALRGIADTVRALRGMKIADVTESFLDLHSALGSVEHALEFLPTAAKYRFNMKALFGEKFSGEAIERQVLGAFKFLEQTGVMRATGPPTGPKGQKAFTAEDKKRAEEYFDVISKITAATGGRITGQELMPLAGRGGMSMMGMTPEGLKNLVFIMQEMGGPSTGTALMTAFSKFVGGTLRQPAMKNLMELGLVDKHKVEFTKAGLPKRFEPGAIPIADLLQKDPLEFADAMAKAMKEKKGINPNDINAVTREVMNLVGGQGRTAGNLIAKMIVMRDVIRKDADIVTKAKGVNDQYAQSLESIAGKVEELKAAEENARASIGMTMLGMYGALAKEFAPTIKALSDFLMMHPQAAKMAGGVLLLTKGLSGLAQTMTVLRLSGLLGGGGLPGAAGSGMGMGMSLATGVSRGLQFGVIGLAAAGIGELLISKFIDTPEAIRNAEEAGRVLGESIREGMKEQLFAASADAAKAMRDARAPAEAKLRLKSLRLERGKDDLGWKEETPPILQALAAIQYGGGNAYEKGYGWSPYVTTKGGPEMFVYQELQKAQFKTADDVKRFLEEAKVSLTRGGSGELYAALEGMMARAVPGMFAVAQELMEEQAKKDAEIAQASAQATQQATTQTGFFSQAVGQAAEQLNHLRFNQIMLPTGPGSTPPLLAGPKFGGPGTFHFEPLPKRLFNAEGGIAMRATAGIFGEAGPEALLPLNKLSEMVPRTRGGVHVEIHSPITIHGNASERTVASFRDALSEHRSEILRLIDDYARDRALGS